MAYWQGWLIHNPDRADTVEAARELIRTASLPASPSLARRRSVIAVGPDSRVAANNGRRSSATARRAGGGWLVVLSANRGRYPGTDVCWLAGPIWMQYGPEQSIRTIRTITGQTRTIRLPDNSTVTLFPNSSVRYARCWTDESPRAVWLQGEANFSVVHRSDTSSARLFRVHTPDLTVEAVGTAFRVRQHPECTHVALTSGHINLLVSQQKTIRLQPGDSVEVTAGSIQPLP